MELCALITVIHHQGSMLLLGLIMLQADHIAHLHQGRTAHQADPIALHLVAAVSAGVVLAVAVAEDVVVNTY